MSKIGISIFTAFLVSCISGCDFVHGVSHVRLDSPNPDMKCLEKAVLAVPGVSAFEYRNEEGGRPLTMHGIEKPNQIHRFLYQYSGLNGNFYFLVNYKGEAEFRHTFIDINRTPPQKDIDKIRPVMFQIENEIEKQCGLVGFAAQVIEECIGVECD